MESHNVCTRCLQTIWNPRMCILTKELFPSTKNWPEDGPLKPKHVASCVLIDYISVVFQYVTLSYCVKQRDGFYHNLYIE
jgi:hypothetical protein